MDMISGVGPASLIDPRVHAAPPHDAIHGLGASKAVATHPDGSVVTTVTDAEGRVVSRGVASAAISTVTTPHGAVLDRIMSPRGGVMYVRMVSPPVPDAGMNDVPPADRNRVPPKHVNLLV